MTEEAGTISQAEAKFEKWRQTVGLFLGPIVLIVMLLNPIDGLDPAAARLAAVLCFALIWWMTEAVPIPVTALLAPALCIVLGVGGAKSIMEGFAHPIVFIFIGSFIMARAMTVHKLDRRFALSILSVPWIGNSTGRVLFAFGFIAAFLSLWLSNTASTAMLVPIAIGITAEVAALMSRQTGKEVSPHSLKFSTGLMLMLAYGASIGGLGTPIGTPPNLIGIGMIQETLGINIGFVQWMIFAIPIVIAMFLVLYIILLWMHPPEVKKLDGLADYLLESKSLVGNWTRGQINTLIAFGTAVVLWVLPGLLGLIEGSAGPMVKRYNELVPEGVAALIGATLLFLLPVNWSDRKFTITWPEAVKIDWGTVLLFGSGIALGGLAFSTGLADGLGQGILYFTGVSGAGAITLISITLAVFVSEATSNTASATMVIPVAIAVAQQAGIDPIGPALGACMGASYGFMLPVSTAPNAIVYGTGMVPITKMARTGIVFDIAGIAVIWCGVMIITSFL